MIQELNLAGKKPEDIDDAAPLFGAGLGLDSLDALQLAMVVEYRRKTYRRLRCDRARRKHSCDSRSVINYDTVERTVLDYLAVFAAGPNGPSPEIQRLNERIAENVRVREAKTNQLNSLIDALADGDSRAVMQRVLLLEGAIDQLDADLAQDTQQRDILLSTPDRADEAEDVERIREEINDPDPDIRHYARSRINMALRRLIDRIDLNSDGPTANDTNDADAGPIALRERAHHDRHLLVARAELVLEPVAAHRAEVAPLPRLAG